VTPLIDALREALSDIANCNDELARHRAASVLGRLASLNEAMETTAKERKRWLHAFPVDDTMRALLQSNFKERLMRDLDRALLRSATEAREVQMIDGVKHLVAAAVKAEHQALIDAIEPSSHDAKRSEFHRGWSAACQMVLGLIRARTGESK